MHREDSKQAASHAIALGTSDLGFWCYECDAYIDHLRGPRRIFEVYQQAHVAKFGKNSEVPYLGSSAGRRGDVASSRSRSIVWYSYAHHVICLRTHL